MENTCLYALLVEECVLEKINTFEGMNDEERRACILEEAYKVI
jgi:hypothetical protein